MPRGLRNAGALALRYHAQTLGYLLLLRLLSLPPCASRAVPRAGGATGSGPPRRRPTPRLS